VAQNDIIVVHTSGGNPALCNPGNAASETTAVTQYPKASFGANYDTAWDWYSPSTGLTSSDNVLSVSDDAGAIEDAVLAANAPSGTVTAASEAEAARAAAAGQWHAPGGGVPVGGFVDDAFRANAVLDLDATGTSAAGNSIQRTSDSDVNDKTDWTTGAGAASTFGVLNAGQAACCPVTVYSIQTGAVGAGSGVTLDSRLVTGVTADRKNLWIQEQPGDLDYSGVDYSGVYVFRGSGAPDLDPSLVAGSRVTVIGTVQEFAGETQVAASSVTVTAALGEVPAVTDVTAAAVTSDPNAEAYEGVLVRIASLKVTAAAIGDVLTLRDDFGATVLMDDKAYDYAAASYPLGTCFAFVTGVMSENGSGRLILPRSPGDLVGGGTCN